MSSKEIAKKRKSLEQTFQKEANILNGQLTNTKEKFDLAMKELQKECPHVWDSGEDAIQRLAKISICVICRKKFER